MVIERKITLRRYVFAFVLTIFIFIFGLMVGVVVTENRINYVENLMESDDLNYESIALQENFLDLPGIKDSDFCDMLSKTLDSSMEKLERDRKKLERYILASYDEDSEEFKTLKRQYSLSEIKYWLLYLRNKQICDWDSVHILFFYSNEKDLLQDSKSQGDILTYIKDLFGERALIFSLDADFSEEPLIGFLKSKYNIKELPAVIVEEKRFDGLTKKEVLIKEICSYYKEKPQDCKNDM